MLGKNFDDFPKFYDILSILQRVLWDLEAVDILWAPLEHCSATIFPLLPADNLVSIFVLFSLKNRTIFPRLSSIPCKGDSCLCTCLSLFLILAFLFCISLVLFLLFLSKSMNKNAIRRRNKTVRAGRYRQRSIIFQSDHFSIFLNTSANFKNKKIASLIFSVKYKCTNFDGKRIAPFGEKLTTNRWLLLVLCVIITSRHVCLLTRIRFSALLAPWKQLFIILSPKNRKFELFELVRFETFPYVSELW